MLLYSYSKFLNSFYGGRYSVTVAKMLLVSKPLLVGFGWLLHALQGGGLASVRKRKKIISDINKNIVLITKYHSFDSHKTSKQMIYEE